MRYLAILILSTFLAASPRGASAEEALDPFLTPTPAGPPESGVSFSARLGYGIPLGAASGVAGDDFSKIFSGSIPIQLGVGWRFNPRIYAGAFFEYAFASLPSDVKRVCDASGFDCSGSDVRVGLDLVYTFLPKATFAPWGGVGVGYEIGKFTYSPLPGQRVDKSFKGFEFAHLMAGVDYRLSPVFRIGPFVNFTLARFSTVETPIDSNGNLGPMLTLDVANKAFHGWLQFGVKIAADL